MVLGAAVVRMSKFYLDWLVGLLDSFGCVEGA
jgi:hypothetical protein